MRIKGGIAFLWQQLYDGAPFEHVFALTKRNAFSSDDEHYSKMIYKTCKYAGVCAN